MDPTSVDIHPPTAQRGSFAPAQTRPTEQQDQRSHRFLAVLSSFGEVLKVYLAEEQLTTRTHRRRAHRVNGVARQDPV
jgi:hypothetical protein